MARSPDSLRAAVYLDSERAHELAREALDPGAPHEGGSFSGVAEGWLTPDALTSLTDAGLVVELLDVEELSGGVQAQAPEAPGGPQRTLAESTELLDEIKQQSRTVSFSQDEQALEEDVYNIDIPGPITQEQRLQLDKLGVDIAAYEPDFGYRAFLTREQYAAVQELPYVAAIARYSFEQALTPELLEVVKAEDAGEQPELMGEPQEQPESQVFDCVVHREADVVRVRELIDKSPDTEIVGSSNLRVRFKADARVPFLAALAALPEVRKLSPYQAPTL